MDFSYEVQKDYGIIDERGSRFIALREVSWSGREAKLELRRWNMDAEGNEKPDKGFTFLTDKGPHELVRTMLNAGYGDSVEVLTELKDREDFEYALDIVVGGYKPKEDENLFDPNEVLFMDK